MDKTIGIMYARMAPATGYPVNAECRRASGFVGDVPGKYREMCGEQFHNVR